MVEIVEDAVLFGHPKGGGETLGAAAADRPLVVIIDPRVLTAQCLVVALQTLDPSTRFVAVHSVAAVAGIDAARSALLVVCVPAGAGVRAACSEAMAEIRRTEPRVPVALLADDESSATVFACIEAGACGYIPTSMTVSMVVQVLKLVQTGCMFVPSGVMHALAKPNPAPAVELQLSSTQRQIADYIRKGSPNKVIAQQLGMSENTVKVQVRSILRKMKVRNRTELSYRSNQPDYNPFQGNRPPSVLPRSGRPEFKGDVGRPEHLNGEAMGAGDAILGFAPDADRLRPAELASNRS